jgi:hypothetical protein
VRSIGRCLWVRQPTADKKVVGGVFIAFFVPPLQRLLIGPGRRNLIFYGTYSKVARILLGVTVILTAWNGASPLKAIRDVEVVAVRPCKVAGVVRRQ